jgi:hypothetical protein
MLKKAYLLLLVLILIPSISSAETVDVHIKGVDDGIRTSIQQDYKEAVLFAKREAIERAGVKVKSLTTAKDFVIYSDYIESKAEAVLLPGYSIIDVGYQQNGTYLVILSGKVKTSTPPASSDVTKSKVIERDGRYVAYDNGTVKDTKTGLMWASKDNGEYINWKDAKRYCENYRGGGYTDWRLPTQDELAELYEPNTTNTNPSTGGCSGGYHINKLFHITCCCSWASETRGYFGFGNGNRYWYGGPFVTYDKRALPVRGGN